MLIPDDDRPDAPAVAVISHAFWQSRFGERPDVIGQTIYVQDIPVVVVGVMPPRFFGTEVGRRPDLMVPAALVVQTMPQVKVLTQDGFAAWNLIGRCRPGANPAQARAALRVLGVRQPPTRAGDVTSPRCRLHAHVSAESFSDGRSGQNPRAGRPPFLPIGR